MNSIRVVEISGRKALQKFVQFQRELYKGEPNFVPPMLQDELNSYDAHVNPAFEFCEAVFYMAYRGQEPVGRVAGIINHRFNEEHDQHQCRFGYCDFVDDREVSRALLDAVAAWGKAKGMNTLEGPLAMTDLDFEGCLVEGYDRLATFAGVYNYPYYREHYEAYGMRPEAFWNEYRMEMIDYIPEKHLRVADMVRRRYGLKVLKITDRKVIVPRYGQRIFDLLNVAYGQLYGFSQLTQRQIDYYIQLWLKQVRLDLVRLVVDEDDQLVAFGVACPSLSKAQQRARGRMWPLGWLHLARAMYLTRNSFWGRLLHGGTDTVDLLLVAVRPDMQGKGVNALLFTDLIPQFMAHGYRYVETNHELDTNNKVQNQWLMFNPDRHKRSCTFAKEI